MKKDFALADERFQEEFMNIFAIGLTCCLERGLIDTSRAEQWLFSPVYALNMKREPYSDKFLFAMEYASELDATRGTAYYAKSVLTARDLFCGALEQLKQLPYDKREHFIDGICKTE